MDSALVTDAELREAFDTAVQDYVARADNSVRATRLHDEVKQLEAALVKARGALEAAERAEYSRAGIVSPAQQALRSLVEKAAGGIRK